MSSGLYRLIQDFSYPWHDTTNGINAMVPKENKQVSYSGIDDVAQMALQLGSLSWAMRIDIKHAFKCLPLAPSQWHYTGFKFLGAFFIHTQTPFGASASCLHFKKVARLLRWIIQNEQPSALITNYLDDFWLTKKTKSQLVWLSELFTRIIEKEISFPISHNKTLGPSTKLDFVGLTADLVHLRILLPEDKRTKCLNIINKLLKTYSHKQFVMVKDLERCTGVLNYACQAIPVARPWLQLTYALQWISGDHVTDRTISTLVMKDLTMFKSFLEGKDYFVKSVPFLDRLGKIYSPLEIKADAAGNPLLGLGCFLPHTGEWFGKLWSKTDWFHKSSGLEAHRIIYQLELFAITLAFKVFGPDIQGWVVILRSDNIAVVNSINKMTSHLESAIKSQKAQIHTLKETIDVLTTKNATLKRAHGQKFSKGKQHKQMWTSQPGKDIMTEGMIMYPSPSIVDEIKKMKDTHVTQKYVDPNGEARRLPIIKLKSNMYIVICRRLSKRFRIHQIYTQGQGTKVDWIAIPKNQRITRSMRVKCLSTLYNCCKYGVLHWPDMGDEFDLEDTDEELLEELNEAGHSDNPEHYSHIFPEPTIWEPFIAKLKKHPRQSQSTLFRIQMHQKSQWECASTSSKIETLRAAMQDQDKLLTILKSLGIISSQSTEIWHDQLEDIISTMQEPGKTPQPSTRASKKKKWVWALLPDLAIKKHLNIGHCKEIIAEKAKQQEIKSRNTTSNGLLKRTMTTLQERSLKWIARNSVK